MQTVEKPSAEDMLLGEDNGFLGTGRDHPKCVEVQVRHNRAYNGPNGEHHGPNSRLWMARIQLEPNAGIVMECGSKEHTEFLKNRKANRKAGSQTRS